MDSDYQGHIKEKIMIKIISNNLAISIGETKKMIKDLAKYIEEENNDK